MPDLAKSLFSKVSTGVLTVLTVRRSVVGHSVGVSGAVKSLESDVKLEYILINKKAAEVSKIYLGRHVYMYLLIYRPDLFDYAELFAHLDECVDCAVEVFTIVTC